MKLLFLGALLFLSGRGVCSPGALTMQHLAPPARFDLTREGTADWAIWGSSGSQVIEVRKTNVAPQIARPTLSGPYSNISAAAEGPSLLDWSDGVPMKNCLGRRAYIFANGVAPQYTLSVAADTQSRTLKLLCGHWYSQAHLRAVLSDGSAPEIRWTPPAQADSEGRYLLVFRFRASRPDQRLTIFWRKTNPKDFGNVALSAAALSGPVKAAPALKVALSSPPENLVLPLSPGAKVRLEAQVRGAKRGASARFFEGMRYLGTVSRPPYRLETELPDAPEARFRADVTDDAGVMALSNERLVELWVPETPAIQYSKSAAKLEGALQSGVDEADFSREGTLDWIHWGFSGHAVTVNRKANASPMISNFRPLDPLRLPDIPGGYNFKTSWSDGALVKSANRVGNGYAVSGTDNGFEFSVPADTRERTLKVYASLWGGCYGRLNASLSDASAPDWVDDSFRSQGEWQNGVYTLRYRAKSDGQKLKVRLAMHNKWIWGRLFLTGATLGESVAVTSSDAAKVVVQP